MASSFRKWAPPGTLPALPSFSLEGFDLEPRAPLALDGPLNRPAPPPTISAGWWFAGAWAIAAAFLVAWMLSTWASRPREAVFEQSARQPAAAVTSPPSVPKMPAQPAPVNVLHTEAMTAADREIERRVALLDATADLLEYHPQPVVIAPAPAKPEPGDWNILDPDNAWRQ